MTRPENDSAFTSHQRLPTHSALTAHLFMRNICLIIAFLRRPNGSPAARKREEYEFRLINIHLLSQHYYRLWKAARFLLYLPFDAEKV